MNGYLFTAGITTSQIVPVAGRGGRTVNQFQTWDSCLSAIICGGDVERAQARFEAWCQPPPTEENPPQMTIRKIVAAQFVEQWLAEQGASSLDWPVAARRIGERLQETATDEFEQGYWVDTNEAVSRSNPVSELESLKMSLAEDIRSGLNWSEDKQFFFMLSVLSPIRPVGAELETGREGTDVEPEAPILDQSVTELPEMRDKEAAALIEARNSVVAAWLWRKYAADTRLAGNDILITPCCAIVPPE